MHDASVAQHWSEGLVLSSAFPYLPSLCRRLVFSVLECDNNKCFVFVLFLPLQFTKLLTRVDMLLCWSFQYSCSRHIPIGFRHSRRPNSSAVDGEVCYLPTTERSDPYVLSVCLSVSTFPLGARSFPRDSPAKL